MYREVGIDDKSDVCNTDLVEPLGLENLLTQITYFMKSANDKKKSRGAYSH